MQIQRLNFFLSFFFIFFLFSDLYFSIFFALSSQIIYLNFLSLIVFYFFLFNIFFFFFFKHTSTNYFFLKTYYYYFMAVNLSLKQNFWFLFIWLKNKFFRINQIISNAFIVSYFSQTVLSLFTLKWKPLFKRSSYIGYYRSSRTRWL